MLNKKVLAAAVIGGLFAGNAAAANLSASPVVPAYYAQEIVATTAAPVILTTNTANNLSWSLGYNFSEGEVKYVRIKTTGKFKFGTTPVIEVRDAGGATVATGVVGSINGIGTDVLTFSITSPTALLTSAHTIHVTAGAPTITGTDEDVNAEVALYDQASQAQNGGELGRVSTSVFSGAYIKFVKSYELITAANSEVADVESPVQAFTQFVDGSSTKLIGNFGNVTLRLKDPDGAGVQASPYIASGAEVTFTDLFHADSALRFDGDFSYTASAGATAYDAAAKARVAFAGYDADALTANSATIITGDDTFSADDLEITTRPLNVLSETSYAVTFVPKAATAAYSVSNLTADLGKITRNGTELQAPLAQVPGGWIARVALTNTGSIERPFAISVLNEEGKSFEIDASKLTGTVPANGVRVIELNTAALVGNHNRGTLNVTVAGPNNQIQGLYQIVNPNNGLVNNHVMVRPGTN